MINFSYLEEQLKEKYIILFRSHYFIANNLDLKQYEGFLYDVSQYEEVNDLYYISDLLITDYSSVFFDYANLLKPMIFYMYDYDQYKNQLRDFYIDLEELPGVIIKSKNEKKLCNVIKNISSYQKRYQLKYQKFHQKFNYLDGKDCSKKVLEECILNGRNK